ncbi:low temperature requirement protein A [Streptococcus gallolyticus]|uniref:Low temperature requirement protein A n=1 Tax=Streptococcus gallolyticus TaxID=315405 RepID=A0A368UF92_9STRE|nr:low temperature requirement protein A [Streptococcus gallolyticus]RCW17610.1 low temperature requirement protein A [Streptococcus gallolyticus]
MPELIAKRVSNYELFFDLTFILGTSQLTASIHLSHVGVQEILSFMVLNIILLNLWVAETLYYNRYGDSRRIDIFSVIALMFVVGNLALTFDINTAHLYAGHPTVVCFNWLLILAYAIIALQYFLKGRVLGFNRDIRFSIVACVIYGVSLLPFALGLLGANIWSVLIYLIPNIVPILTRHYHESSRINFPHVLERAQLMTILTLGETVIAIISTYPLTESLYQGALLFAGMSFMFISYMTQTFVEIDHHRQTAGLLLLYAHIPIVIGINIFTVGIEFLADSHHANLGFAFVLFGFLSFYAGILTTTHYNHSFYQLHLKTYLKIGLLLGIGAASMFLVRHHILLLALVLCATTWAYNHYFMAVRRKKREYHNIPHPDPRKNLRDFS